jgi:hypothetical protein
MELSEIVKFNGKLLVMCDKTGIVYEVLPSGKAVQRWAVADGTVWSGHSVLPAPISVVVQAMAMRRRFAAAA